MVKPDNAETRGVLFHRDLDLHPILVPVESARLNLDFFAARNPIGSD